MDNVSTETQPDKYRNHAQVWELLPWHINGSLSARENKLIVEHTAVCLICRKELGLQAALRDLVKNHELDEVMVTAGFDRLSARLRNQDTDLRVPRQISRPGPEKFAARLVDALTSWFRQPTNARYLVAAMLVLAIVIILPGPPAALFVGNNTFSTLSNPQADAPVAADLRLIFVDGISASEREAILDEAGLGIVSGPDERGLYFVNAGNVSASALEVTLSRLHDNEQILFAEFVIGSERDSLLPGGR